MAYPSFHLDALRLGSGEMPPGYFTPPRLPLGHVTRSRLTHLIEAPYPASLTLITADAGTGKTTLAAEWALQSTAAVGWVTLDTSMRDASGFASAIRVAIQTATCRTTSPSCAKHDDPADALYKMARSLDQDACVVIDDWESGADSAFTAIIEGLLAIAESSVRLVIVGRTTPSLRLARLRAQGQVRDLGTDDLRLTRTEAEAIVRANAQFELSQAQLEWLVSAADGWVAGLKLLLQKTGSTKNGSQPNVWLGASAPSLDEYVEQEILSFLAPEIRSFALAASNLPWVAQDICDETIDAPLCKQPPDTLSAEIPFLWSDPGHVRRLRFHPLVRDSLRRLARAKTPASNARQEQRRLAEWLIHHGEIEEAARIALDMSNLSDMATFLEPICRHLAERSHFEALDRWLAQVPEPVFAKHLDLAWWRFVAQAGMVRLRDATASLENMEPRALASESTLFAGRMLLAHGGLATLSGQEPEGRELLQESLRLLPADVHPERMYATTMLGEIAFRQGSDMEAARAFRQAEQYAARLPLDELWSWGILAPGRANGYAIRGDVNSAITKYRLIISEIPRYLEHTGIACLIRCRLVSLYIERNELDAARHELELIEPQMHGPPHAWTQEAVIAKARLLVAEGRRVEAEEWASTQLSELRRMPGKSQLVHLLASIWLRRGEYSMVESWLEDIRTMEPPGAQIFGDIDYRLLALDLALAQGRYAEVVESTQQVARAAAARSRRSDVISLSVRQAVAIHHQGHADLAEKVLRTALELGATKGFVHSFTISGEDMHVMFANIWSQRPEYQAILRSLRARQNEQATRGPAIISKREREVLLLVARGHTNQQVADEMFISANTVRNHLVRICQRLDAHTRSEAVARARKLGLLD